MPAHDPHLDSGLVEEPGERVSDDARPAPDRTGRAVERVVLGIYVLVLVWVVLLKIHTDGFGDLVGRRSINVVPFGGTGTGGLGSSELAINVLAFIPLGVLVHLTAQRRNLARGSSSSSECPLSSRSSSTSSASEPATSPTSSPTAPEASSAWA